MCGSTPLGTLLGRLAKAAAVLALGAIALPLATATVAYAQDIVVDFDVDPPISAIAGDTPTFGSQTTFGFRVEVFEDGEDDAEDVVFEFFVPEHTFVTFIESDPTDPLTCQAGTPGDPSNPASCRLGDIDEGDSVFIDIELHVNADTPELTVLDLDMQACFEDDDADGTPPTSCEQDEFPPDNELHFFTTVTTEADLSIGKTSQPAGAINAGESLSYEIVIGNAGPSVARGVLVVDTLPEGAIFRSAEVLNASGSGSTEGSSLHCAFAANVGPAGTVTCELGDVAPSPTMVEQMRVQIEIDVDPSLPPTAAFSNQATVTSVMTADPNVADNSAEAVNEISDLVSLELRKSSMPLHPVAGETFLYSFEVLNLGPADARDVEFVDILPSGLAADGSTVFFEYVDDGPQGVCTLISTAPDEISCRPAGSPFSVPPYVLPAGESVTFSILVRIPPELLPGTYRNAASVSVGNLNFAITSTGDDLEVRSVADLKISKFVSPHNDVRAGEQFTYTILVDNLGPSTAYDVVVTDTLIASGLVQANGCSLFVRTSGGTIDEFDCNFALSTGVFELATMGADHLNPRSPTDEGRMRITINATADQPIDLTNVTTVTSDSEDPDTGNNMAMVAHSVTAVSDLSVTKTAVGEVVVDDTCGADWIFDPNAPGAFPAVDFVTSNTNVTAGRRIRYTLTVTNNGPSNAENVVLGDRLPAGVTIVPGSLVASQGACQTGTPGEPLDRLICGLGELADGDVETVTFDVVVDPSLPAGMVLENDAFVSGDAFDLDNGDNYAFTHTIVNTWADTEITKLSVGEVVDGIDPATDRPIIEELPGEVTAGRLLRYELTVQNRGSSLARNVQVMDLLPGQTDTGLDQNPVHFLSAEGASCRAVRSLQEFGVFGPGPGQGKFGQILWCNLGDMLPGERKTFDVYVQVDDSVPEGTTLTNGAFVWWGATSPPAQAGFFLGFPFSQIPPTGPITDDPCLDNNYAETDTDVDAVADVRVRKTAVASSLRPPGVERPGTIVAVPGGTLTYRFEVTNRGPSRALDVVLTDALDPQLAFRYATSATCMAGPPVTCDLGPLAPGETRIFEIVVEVAPDAFPTEILNLAQVNWTLPGGTPQGPVFDDEVVPVRELADLRIQKFGKRDGQVRAGDILTYTVIVDNYGPSFATATAIKDLLQSSYRFDLIDITSDRDMVCTSLPPLPGGATTIPGTPWPPALAPPAFGVDPVTGIAAVQERLELDCTLLDDPATPADESRLEVLRADGPPNSGRWILTMRVRATQLQDINNRATVLSDASDPDYANNSARVEHEITSVSDVRVTKTAVGEVVVDGGCGFDWIFDPNAPGPFPAPGFATSPTNVTAGRRISYTVSITNDGPSVAENVWFSDRLPPGVTIVPGSLVASQGSCETGTPGDPLDRLRCGIGVLADGASATVTFHAVVDAGLAAGTVLENDVFASAGAFDDDNSNNHAFTHTIVNTWADTEIAKISVGETVFAIDATTDRPIVRQLLGQATAGRLLRYELTVQNRGSSVARNAQVLDLLPGQADTGLAHDPVHFLRADGATCRPVENLEEIGVIGPGPGQGKFGQVVWCSVGDLQPGERRTFDLYVQVDDSVPENTTLTNGAYVWWGTTSPPAQALDLILPISQIPPNAPITDDPCTDNNYVETDTDIDAVADVRVVKTAVASSLRPPDIERPDTIVAVPGGTLTYRFEVTNRGPSRAFDVVLTDLLDPQLTYRYSTTAACVAGPPVTCELGPLAPGETRVFDIVVEVAPDAIPTEILNTAEVNWALAGGTAQGPVFDDEIVPVRELADLRIQKFGKRDGQVRAGDILTYTVIVDNYGPSYATETAIKDVLQSSFRFDLIDIISDRDATCTTLANGALATNDLVAAPWPPVMAPPAFGVIPPTGIAMIQERLEADCNLRDDPATPADESRLEVLQADGPPNSGRWILTMRVRAMEDQDVNNRAEVTSAATDPDVGNNSAAVEHEITAVSDIEVTKQAVGEVQVVGQMGTIFDPATPGQAFPEAPNYTTSPTEVTAGRRIQYTITVVNHGPTYAENVVLTDRLPEGVAIYAGSLMTSQGSCETGTPGEPLDRLVCGLGGLSKNPGSNTATITFEVITDPNLAPGTMLENDAFATSDNFDPTNENNHANTQTVVNTWADLELAKGAVGENKVAWDATLRRFVVQDIIDSVTAGGELRYELVVQNKGASTARNVQIADALPLVAGSSTQATTFLRAVGAVCGPDDVNANLIFCNVGDLEPGERRTVDIYVLVDEVIEDGTVLFNVAQALFGPSSPPAQPPTPLPPGDIPTLGITNDPFTANNLAFNETTVNAIADVYIEKVDVPAAPDLDQPFEPDWAVAGEEHRYLITFGNKGWSTARNIDIEDILDPGEVYSRCEPFDLDDEVLCSEAGGVVNVDFLEVRNEQIIPAPGVLKAGEEFSFWLIVDVKPGFVLDEPDFIAEDTATISTSTGPGGFAQVYGPAEVAANDLRLENNLDRHDTLIIARADLSVEKTDIFAGGPAGPGNAFLQCDPVQPGGMITYELTVTNNGPSDAAQVYLVDYLPTKGVALDPAQVMVDVTNGQVVEVRDDGRITVIIGNDPSDMGMGPNQLGRLNAGSSETVTIQVMVGLEAECGSFLVNRATVETRRNDAIWPPALGIPVGNDLIGGGPRTPTFDPNPANDTAVETTRVECPSVKVKKTVSYDGTCPGVDIRTINQTAQPVTFCFEITNDGTTWLDTILITDTLVARTNGMPVVIYTDTIRYGADPKFPVAPGETVERQVTIPHLTKECGIASDYVDVTAVAVNSGRTILPCLNVEPAHDERFIDIPCAGLDWRLQLPVLDTEMCESWVQVQNVGHRDTKAALVVWGEAGACPPQAAGPLKVECSGLLRPGAAWSFAAGQLPAGAKSAVVYSLNAVDRVPNLEGNLRPFDQVACDAMFRWLVGDYNQWAAFDDAYRLREVYRSPFDGSGLHQVELDFGATPGEPIAVSVNRSCPDPVDPNLRINAAYTGISSDMVGARDPRAGAYSFFAPLVFAGQNGMNSSICIQNSGTECTSLEIWFKAQDNCLRAILADVLSLAPGETICFDPNTVVGPDWLGSAWIRSTQPLGIVVDTKAANHFTSYNGFAADVSALDFTYGNMISYLPLTYSEYQGWDTAIQVQNLSGVTAAKVKIYFLDRAGGIITTLVDWICPYGSQTFFLPVLAALPGNWVGSARVESQEWWSPGQPLVEPPRVASVALMERWSDPARTMRREAVAYNGRAECLLFDWQIAPGTKGGLSSGSAVFAIPLVAKGNRGITSEIGITNLVPKPGFTDFAIYFYDQNGLLGHVCQKLNEKQVEYINLDTWGFIQQGYLGSMVVSAVFWEHDVFDGEGRFERNLVGLGGVAVERIGGVLGQEDVPGDESKAFEAFPVFDHFAPEEAPNCPGVPGALRP